MIFESNAETEQENVLFIRACTSSFISNSTEIV